VCCQVRCLLVAFGLNQLEEALHQGRAGLALMHVLAPLAGVTGGPVLRKRSALTTEKTRARVWRESKPLY